MTRAFKEWIADCSMRLPILTLSIPVLWHDVVCNKQREDIAVFKIQRLK